MSVKPFRGGARPTLGVELELQLVDPRTFDLVAAADAVMASVPDAMRESVKPEFYPSCVEINTGICQDVESVGLDLSPKLDAVAGVAADHGARLAWGGTHPFAHWLDQPITPDQLAASFYHTLGIDHQKEYHTSTGRPIMIVREGGLTQGLW